MVDIHYQQLNNLSSPAIFSGLPSTEYRATTLPFTNPKTMAGTAHLPVFVYQSHIKSDNF